MGNRADLVAGIGTVMTAFISANPTLLKRHFRVRPETAVTDWPCSYLDLRPVSVHYDGALRQSEFTPSIVFVNGGGDNDQAMAALDALVDAFTDHLDSYPHLVAGTAWSDGQWSEESVPLSNDTSAPGVRWTFGPITFLDGRT